MPNRPATGFWWSSFSNQLRQYDQTLLLGVETHAENTIRRSMARRVIVDTTGAWIFQRTSQQPAIRSERRMAVSG